MADGRHFAEIDKWRYLHNGFADHDEIRYDDAYWILDLIGRPNFKCAENQDGGRPLPEVVYISIMVGRKMTGIVSCESEQRGLFQIFLRAKWQPFDLENDLKRLNSGWHSCIPFCASYE